MLKNKTIAITGASSGLGKEIAFLCARKGANLALCARRYEKLCEIKESISKEFPDVLVEIFQCDVTNKKNVEDFIMGSINALKGIDYLILNAGKSMWSRFSDIDDPNELYDLMRLNYMGVVYPIFFALPHLRKKHGTIGVVSSIQGALPVAFHSGYVASKFAVNGFIETLRLEEPNVHFTLLMPSWISGTELRDHALKSGKEGAVNVKNHDGKKVISAKDVARIFLKSIEGRESEVFIPKKYHFIPKIRQVMKTTVDKIIMNKVKGQLKK